MRNLLFLLAVMLFLFGCSSNNEKLSSDHQNWDEVELKYAQHFRLLKKGKNFNLILLDPDTQEEVQQIPIIPETNERIICLTATLTGMFCELDARSVITGVTAENQLYDVQLKKRFQRGDIHEYGDFTQLSLERVAEASPNIILYNFVNNDFPHKEKLEKLGVKLVVVNDWLEAHPLAKAEWIKVVGALTGKFDKACTLFDEIEENYLNIQQKVSGFQNQPSIISGNLIGGSWYAPSGENYFGILIKDAGGDYVYKDTKGARSLALPLEKILEDNENTAIWLNPGVSTKDQLIQLNSHAALLSAFESGTYSYSGNSNKFWEQSATRADFMLNDLAHIFHPEMDEDYQFHYYAPLQP